jgi:hypothetical protein
MAWFLVSKLLITGILFIGFTLSYICLLMGVDFRDDMKANSNVIFWGIVIFSYTCSTLGAMYLWVKERDIK